MAKKTSRTSSAPATQPIASCCGAAEAHDEQDKLAPSHVAELNRINRIKGQLDGIRKMIEERKYCPDILTQTSAVRSAVASLEAAILEKHLHACVRDAFETDRASAEEKIEELLAIFRKAAR